MEELFGRGLESASAADPSTIVAMADVADDLLIGLLEASGFEALPDTGSSSWLAVQHRPAVSPLAKGYRILSRDDVRDAPHHMIMRSGPHVEERLRQTTLYRPDLDLVVVDSSNNPVAYGLCWFDPTTETGLIEPMRTEDDHSGRGLARHVLTTGVDLLARVGASRIKINYEHNNTAASSLYRSPGFRPVMTRVE